MKPIIVVVFVFIGGCLGQVMKSRWSYRDAFDNIKQRFDRVNAKNCEVKHSEDLHLPPSSVSHVPVTKELGTQPLFPNRTGLLQVHNMALSRGIFFR